MSHNDTMIAMGPHPEDNYPSRTPLTDVREHEVIALRVPLAQRCDLAWSHARDMEIAAHQALAARLKETAHHASILASIKAIVERLDSRGVADPYSQMCDIAMLIHKHTASK